MKGAMVADTDLRVVESIGMLPTSQRTAPIVRNLLSKEFVEAYPALTRMLSSPDLDKNILKMVIGRIRLVARGQESVDAASVDVGNALAQAYFPNMDS